MVDIRSTATRRQSAETSLAKLSPGLRQRALDLLGAAEGDAFQARLEHAYLDIFEPLDIVYGQVTDTATLVASLVDAALTATAARPAPLRLLDRRRETDPGWFQRSRMVGYVCYVDRFADTLTGVRGKLDYLAELGVTYLHLMPLLKPREGANDGGYAVADYDAVDPRLGSMADLEALADDLHRRGMALCVDLVLNHTAAEHAWAQAAVAGDAKYRDFYMVFPDRTMPDAYERTLPEVFPDMAPGSFTFVPEIGGWVWTTFYSFQWDLNYANPDVFAAMLDTMLRLANHGIDILRLDAVPFLWKRLGTDCQNQPEAHLLVQVFRALTRVAAPGLLFKAEAIVAPDMLVQYLGGHDRYRPECELAYHNQLMVMLWSSLAARDARLITQSLTRLRPVPSSTGWVTYVRCHDDIGWAVSDEDAAAVGWNGFAHRRFLNDFYSGRFAGSFARGALFQENPATGDARISGSAASLCGIEAALDSGDPEELDSAIRRLELLYSVVFSFGGIPLIYMGDEIALCNDRHWADDPAQAGDNRWMHRPFMPWELAARRTDPATVEGRVFGAMRGLVEARRAQLALRGSGETTLMHTDNPHLLAYRRRHPRSAPLLAVANFSDHPQTVYRWLLDAAGIQEPEYAYATTRGLDLSDAGLQLPVWGFAWVTTH
jgi:amylosucrase